MKRTKPYLADHVDDICRLILLSGRVGIDMQYHFNEAEMKYLKSNIFDALKNITGVKSEVDIRDQLHKAYDLLMVCAGMLDGKTLGAEDVK
jgi:hypothetical protein